MLIEVKQLTRVYRMGDAVVRAMAGVNLSIEAGEFVSITGASGSGKSTLMHILGGLDRPTGGSYLLNGQSLASLSDRERARIRNRSIGFVFQTFNLINRTSALDNVSVPLIYGRATGIRAKAMAALERVGLGARHKHKPSEMSGGERQRVAIARAVVNHPSVVLADEPTGNLDSHTGAQILNIFHQLHESGVTVILVTHEMNVAAQAQRLIHMTDGVIDVDRPITDELRRELVQDDLLQAVRLQKAPAIKEAG